MFDLNGNIVAMHAQGYVLPTLEGTRCSLMEFGLQFNAICKDIKRKYSENVVEKLFPNYNLDIDGQAICDHPMVVDYIGKRSDLKMKILNNNTRWNR